MLKVKTLKDVVVYVISILQFKMNKRFSSIGFVFFHKKLHGNFSLTDLSHDNWFLFLYF